MNGTNYEVPHSGALFEGRNTFKILTGNPTGKIPLGRPRRSWEDNIRIDLKEIGINTRNWVDSAHVLLWTVTFYPNEDVAVLNSP